MTDAHTKALSFASLPFHPHLSLRLPRSPVTIHLLCSCRIPSINNNIMYNHVVVHCSRFGCCWLENSLNSVVWLTSQPTNQQQAAAASPSPDPERLPFRVMMNFYIIFRALHSFTEQYSASPFIHQSTRSRSSTELKAPQQSIISQPTIQQQVTLMTK